MTRQEKLAWLARNVHEWKPERDMCVVETGDNGATYIRWPAHCLPSWSTFTREDWLSMREKLQNKPELDGSWHERGELPPVGTECEFNHPEFKRFVGCLVVGHFRHEAICAPSGGNYFGGSASKFRPLIQLRPVRTEREKAIDAACEAIGGVGEDELLVIEKLYDAGMLK